MAVSEAPSPRRAAASDPARWRYWGRWNEHMLFTSPWLEYVRTTALRRFLPGCRGWLKILDGHFYVLEEDLARAGRLLEEILPDGHWKGFVAFCDEQTGELREWEGRGDLAGMLGAMVDFCGCSTLVEFLDQYFENHLKEECRRHGWDLPQVFAAMHPARQTEQMRYYAALRKLRPEDIDAFVERFRWASTHAFSGEPLDRERVLGLLEEREQPPEKPTAVPAGAEPLVAFGSELIFLRSNLMEVLDRVLFSYWPLIEAEGRRRGRTFEEMLMLTHEELLEVIDGAPYPEEALRRGRRFGIMRLGGGDEVLVGDALDRELAIHRQDVATAEAITGLPAYPGKVRGRARIVEEREDLTKVEEGDILVTNETTQDYIVAMHRAAAFVTNHGGITCHAAIVARELRKPCVIGTEHATRVFKDGDLIEVDADEGTVRRVE